MGYLKMNSLNILYEDNHILVVEKKEGILSQSDITGDIDLLTIVKEYIKEKYNKPGNVYIGLIHRLDREVGGIMVFARTSKAARRLNEEIKNHNFKKNYVAVLDGIVDKKEGTLINYIYKDEKKKIAKIVDEKYTGAKKAELSYNVLAYKNNKTIVKVNLITGRYNQIRVQFKNIGHPLLGDKKYGSNKNTFLRLFAYELSFIHPVKKELMNFKLLPKWEELDDETIIHRL